MTDPSVGALVPLILYILLKYYLNIITIDSRNYHSNSIIIIIFKILIFFYMRDQFLNNFFLKNW